MKIWKRNAIVATVLVMLCAGIYINWTQNQTEKVDLMQTLDAEQVMGEINPQIGTPEYEALTHVTSEPEDQFARIRLSRQESRDSAVELLQQTMAYEESGTAAAGLDQIVNNALEESQIESLIVAKGFADCVAYMDEDLIRIAVASSEEGLSEADVALISDIVTSQTEYSLSSIRIIEVK